MQSGTRRTSSATHSILEEFHHNGFAVLPNVISVWELNRVRDRVFKQLEKLEGPIEYEADLGYPGAPASRHAPGGRTPRRLLGALDRDGIFLSLALNPTVVQAIYRILDTQKIAVSRAHHNCIMTKFPDFSSDTLWHRDYRFWSFRTPALVTAWFALGKETSRNGSLSVIPGSHLARLHASQFNQDSFLAIHDPLNKPLLDSAIGLRLNPGDVLIFHCHLLHSAMRNKTDSVKISPVFTYHANSNRPTPGTRSSSIASVRVRLA